MINILKFVGILGAVALFIWAMETGFDKNEEVECLKWQSESTQYANYYLTHWQDEQCRAHGIEISAPVQ